MSAMLVLVSCGKSGEVIPRKQMSEIYAEMFVTDQMLQMNNEARRMADTTLVYEPVFKKYGYTSEDYRASIEYYINDPDRFARILRNSGLIVEEKIKELKAEKELIETISEQERSMLLFKPERIYYLTGLYNRNIFSIGDVGVLVDSTGGIMMFDPQIGRDTLFSGPGMLFEDIPAANDSSSTVPDKDTTAVVKDMIPDNREGMQMAADKIIRISE